MLGEFKYELKGLSRDTGNKGYPEYVIFKNLVEVLHGSVVRASNTGQGRVDESKGRIGQWVRAVM